jgi:hypothetical protein
VYKLWAIDGAVRPDGPSDVYLADRESGRFLKTSLHESGNWRTAVTEEAVASGKIRLPDGTDRKVTAWERPAMLEKGLTVAYWIATPSSELRTSAVKPPSKHVHWVKDPGPGKVVQFAVVLASNTSNNIVISDPGPQDEHLLDQIRLRNGEIVGVISRIADLSENATTIIRAAVGSWTLHDPSGGPADPSVRVRCMMFVEGLDGGEGLIDLAIPCLV